MGTVAAGTAALRLLSENGAGSLDRCGDAGIERNGGQQSPHGVMMIASIIMMTMMMMMITTVTISLLASKITACIVRGSFACSAAAGTDFPISCICSCRLRERASARLPTECFCSTLARPLAVAYNAHIGAPVLGGRLSAAMCDRASIATCVRRPHRACEAGK